MHWRVNIVQNLWHMHTALALQVVTTRMCITCLYIIATDHVYVYAKSAELVHTKKSRSLANSLVLYV